MINSDREKFGEFLLFWSFGEVDWNGKDPTFEELEKLRQILRNLSHYRIQSDRKLDGVWPIISFLFSRRSGLFLMTVYQSIGPEKLGLCEELANDLLQVYEPNFSYQYAAEILNRLNQSSRLLPRLFNEWAEKNVVSKSNLPVFQEPIFEEQFSSEPDTFIKDRVRNFSHQQIDTINRRFSCFVKNQQRIEEVQSEQEQTITLSRKIPKCLKLKKKKKHVKRVDFTRARSKLEKFYRESILSKRVEQKKKEVQILLPKKEYDERQRRNKKMEQKRIKRQLRQFQSESFIEEVDDMSSFQRNQFLINDDEDQIHQEQIERRVIDRYEKLSSFQIRQINLDLDRQLLRQYCEEDHEQILTYLSYLQGKEVFKEVKQLIKMTIQRQNQSIFDCLPSLRRILCTKKVDEFNDYWSSYMLPLAASLFTWVECKLIGQIINNLFTSPQNENITPIRECYSFLEIMIKEFPFTSELIYMSLSQIISNSQSITKSLVEFMSSRTLLRNCISFSLQNSTEYSCILLSVVMVCQTIPEKLSLHPDLSLTEQKKQMWSNLKSVYEKQIKQKLKFLSSLREVYQIYRKKVWEDQRESVLSLCPCVEINDESPCIEIIELVTEINKRFIQTKLTFIERPNFKPILNRILCSDIFKLIGEKSQQTSHILRIEAFSLLLTYPIFHESMTMRELVSSIRNIYKNPGLIPSIMPSLFLLLSKAYQLVLVVQGCQNLIKQMQQFLEGYYFKVLQQYEGFLYHYNLKKSPLLEGKVKKWEQKVAECKNFIFDEQLQNSSDDHQFFCLMLRKNEKERKKI